MSNQVTIAIINRGGCDNKLIDTCNNALTVANGATVALVMDGKCQLHDIPAGVDVSWASERPQGTSRTRHYAVMSSNTPYVVTCDSHVVMREGFPQSVADHLGRFPKHVLCARCEMLPDGGIYQGARLNTLVPPDPRQGSTNKLEGEYQAIAAQWRPDDERAGPISSIMGGCYAVGREWYTAMGEPWQYGRGWGCDEETISIASQSQGGMAWLLPDIVGHWMQKYGQYAARPIDAVHVWANRLRIAHTAPMTEEERAETIAYVMQSRFFDSPRHKDAALQILAKLPLGEIKERQSHGPTLEHMRKGIPMKRPELIAALKANKCKAKGIDRMKVDDLQALWDGLPRKMDTDEPVLKVRAVVNEPPAPEAAPEPKPRANYGANEDRRTCHVCGSAASDVYKTRTIGKIVKRYRKCSDCGRLRTTREVLG